MQDIDYCTMGNKIRTARIERNMSQEELAEKCDISTSFLGHIERGTRKLSVETLVSLCSKLNLSIDYVLLDSLPTNDTILLSILENAKKKNKMNYDRYLNIIKALSEVIDKL